MDLFDSTGGHMTNKTVQLTSNELVASLMEGDRVLSAAAPLTYTDHVMVRAADTIERLERELRLAKSARDYANDMLDIARAAPSPPQPGIESAANREMERRRIALDQACDLLECAQPADNLECSTPEEWYQQRAAWYSRNCGADPSVARTALESTDTACGWRVEVYEIDVDVWIRVIGPENQGAAFNTDRNSIRGVVLRQYRDAVKSSAVPEQTAHHWLPNIVGSWTCDWCGAIATCNPAATCAGRDAVTTSASPADLVGALQDVVHTDTGPARAGRGVRISMLPNDLHPGPRCSCAECQGKYPTESEPDGI